MTVGIWVRDRLAALSASRRRKPVLIAGAVVVVIAAGVWALWPARKAPEPLRARPYLEFTACLLTDDQGIAGTADRPVWAGLEDASTSSGAKVQYLAVMGPQTDANARPFLESLIQRHCDLIFAIDSAPVAAVRAVASGQPDVRFYVVTVQPATPLSNVVEIPVADDRRSVAGIIANAARASSR